MFESITIETLTGDGLAQLRAVCEAMQRQAVAAAHHAAYGALAARIRLREEELRREAAAVTIQRAARVMLATQARQREEEARAALERQTQAAVRIQALFRGVQVRRENQLGLLREQQRQRVAEDLRRQEEEQRLAREAAEAKAQQEAVQRQQQLKSGQAELAALVKQQQQELHFTDKMATAVPMVAEDMLALVGRLREEYAAYDAPDKNVPAKKKLSDREKKLQRQRVARAQEALDAAVLQLAAEVRAAMVQQRNAFTVTLPPHFTMDGQPVACGNFFFPAGGTLTWGGDAQGHNKRRLRFHPNRALVHVRDEVTPTASLATAQRYLDELLAAALTVGGRITGAMRKGQSHDFTIAGTTDRNTAITWHLIFQHVNGDDTIIHVDSGYEFSHWRPQGMRGLCPKCGDPQFKGPKHRKPSGNSWVFTCQ
ncbi:MAG: hypothetical protein ACXWZS_11965 [Gemmatirosa sp.]